VFILFNHCCSSPLFCPSHSFSLALALFCLTILCLFFVGSVFLHNFILVFGRALLWLGWSLLLLEFVMLVIYTERL
jgi:hypothetical protein